MKFPFRAGLVAFIALACTTTSSWGQEPSPELGPELGKQVFLEASQPPCAVCHRLADAKAVGEVGPILDDLKPDAERVKAAVVNGIGVMPAYEETLTQEQIDAVARYVATAVGLSK